MINFKEELLELRHEFEKFDKHDPIAIRKWFADHAYLTRIEQAMVAGKSRWYIRKLRERAGLNNPRPKVLPVGPARKLVVDIEVPDNWDTKEWLQAALLRYSKGQIAIAVGRSRSTIRKRILRWKLVQRPFHELVKPANPCFSREWVYDHYITKRLSQQQCANLANISVQNFGDWLARLNVPARRNSSESITPLWQRKLIYNLEHQPVVRTVFLRHDHIHIRLMHYTWESYYPDRTGKRLPFSYNITRDDARLDNVPPISYQYTTDLDGHTEHPGHLQISRRQWEEASLLERRIALHNFGRRIFDTGYVQLTHPTEVLEQELKSLQTIDKNKFIQGGSFTAFPNLESAYRAAGKKIIEHFFDLSCIWTEVLRSPRYITHCLNYLAASPLHFNTHNLIRSIVGGVIGIIKHKHVPRIASPAIYAVVLKRLGIRGPVLDLCPGFGSRAMACAMVGIPYVYRPNPLFQAAINNGFADFIGLQCQEWDGSRAELLLCDAELDMPNVSEAVELAKYADNMLLFVPHKLRYQLQAKLPPKSVIPIKARYFLKQMDYYFLY